MPWQIIFLLVALVFGNFQEFLSHLFPALVLPYYLNVISLAS